MLEAEGAGEQHRPDSNASTTETTPVKVKKLGHVVFTVNDIERTKKSAARHELHVRISAILHMVRGGAQHWFLVSSFLFLVS
jgi:hypothetical protein